MKSQSVLVLLGLLIIPAAWSQDRPSQDQPPPQIDGYVTRAASHSDFDVNGLRLLCGIRTRNMHEIRTGVWQSVPGCPLATPYVGEAMRIWGSKNTKRASIAATRIETLPSHPGDVAGSAVVIQVLARTTAGGTVDGLLLDTDGYSIRLTAKTQISWQAPLHSLADVKAGDWMQYKAVHRADGALVAESATLRPNVVNAGEGKLRKKSDYDPSAVPPSAHQGSVSRIFTGVNFKEIPPYDDAAMQARVSAIGEKLIPAYQRNLPDDDPARIDFRFELIDQKKWKDAETLPSGVILVPHQVVERLQNDSQLAAVLADNIACALEKQTYRAQGPTRAMTAGNLGTAVAGAFVPGLGLVGDAAAWKGSSVLLKREEQQSGRVGLRLMSDAGYDIDQAPRAWWLLASKKAKPMVEIPMPERAAYLYRILGTERTNAAP